MAIEAYIPSSVTFDGRPQPDAALVTLYDPEGVSPRGSLTGPNDLERTAQGTLVLIGTRGGKEWRVTLPIITLVNKTAVGCEFSLDAPPTREVLRELETDQKPHEKGLEERFDIR